MIWIIVVILLILMLAGGVGYSTYGAVGFSPLGLALLVLLILYLTGVLR